MSKRKWTDEELKEAVKVSKSYADLIRYFGHKVSGGMHTFFKGHVLRLGLDTSHFTGSGYLKGKTHNWGKKYSLNDILKKNSMYKSVKIRLFKEGLLTNKCSECGLEPLWNGKELTLHLDHINGDHYDNRLENLRILCPNCHAQTPTYGSKNKDKKLKLPKQRKQSILDITVIEDLVSNISTQDIANKFNCSKHYVTSFCSKNGIKIPRLQKIIWPTNEELSKLIFEKPLIHLGKDLGVSDNAIRKHCMKHEIQLPDKNHWRKIK